MAEGPAEIIRQAILRAREGHPDEAIAMLQESPVASGSPEASHYHYTLGWLLSRQGRTGEAFAHLDFARHYQPADPLIQQAWERTHSELERKLGTGAVDRASDELERWVDSPFSTPLQALLAVMAFAALASAYRKRHAGRWLVVLWLVAFAASAVQFWGSRHAQGRALTTQVLRSGPSEDFLNLTTVEAGSEVRVIQQREGWSQVRIAPETAGWIPESSVLLLKRHSTTRE